MLRYDNRIKKMELFVARHIPPETPPTAAEVVGNLRDAFSYVLTRASMEVRWGSDEWLALTDAARHVAPPHPALPFNPEALSDAGFLKLFREWLAYRSVSVDTDRDVSADTSPPFGFPSAEIWNRFSKEVWQAWQAGTSPAAWKARQATVVSADTPVSANGTST
jgi:hypothetical protein